MIQFNVQNTVKFITIFIILLVQMSCAKKSSTDLSKENIIPKPVSVTATGDSFELTSETTIYVPEKMYVVGLIGGFLADKLNLATGYNIEVKATSELPEAGNIYLTLSKDVDLDMEGYELTINRQQINLVAKNHTGLFRGIQTIRQILPPSIELRDVQPGPWNIPTGTIRDYPEYAYRGSMLDVSRHFFGVNDIKRYIDLLAYYKMNFLHLHLSDDQGWRIEIKSWPELTTVGGSTAVGGGKGGFYTQEDYTEIVRYAKERYITIVPEIDLPGHTNAALASYAELNCDGKKRDLYTGIEVGFSTLCTDSETTYKFLDDVIKELAALTPGPYIHIGGDESLVTEKEDYIYFINRLQKIVNSHGKQMMGWEEIAQADIAANSIVQHWVNAEHAREAAQKGNKIIMSPASKTYLDMQYDSTTRIGLHWAAYIEVDSAYMWDPATFTKGVTRENILGVEAPLWSETLLNIDDIEYMMFPRLAGIAEIGWTPSEFRNWDEYKVRLGQHGERFKTMGINYYQSKLVPWAE